MWAVRLKAEAVSVLDTLQRRMWAVRMAGETLSLSETMTRRGRFTRLINEGLAVLESWLHKLQLYLGLEEIRLSSPITLQIAEASAFVRSLEFDSEITKAIELRSYVTI